MHWPVVSRPIGELINALLIYQTRRRVVLFTIVLSLISHLGLLVGFYLGALALHPDATVILSKLADYWNRRGDTARGATYQRRMEELSPPTAPR